MIDAIRDALAVDPVCPWALRAADRLTDRTIDGTDSLALVSGWLLRASPSLPPRVALSFLDEALCLARAEDASTPEPTEAARAGPEIRPSHSRRVRAVGSFMAGSGGGWSRGN